jgi:hypothetical protein
MITTAHTYLDGRGILYLFDALFSIIASPSTFSFGSEHSRLPLSEDTLLGVPPVPTEENIQRAATTLRRFIHDKPIRMPVKDMQQIPGDSDRQELRLSVAISDAVVKACKQRGYTVTYAWHAAIVNAVLKIQAATGEPGTTYTSFVNYDLRKYFPATFDPRSQPISCYHSGTPLQVKPEGKSFDQISNALRETYQTEFISINVRSLPTMVDMMLPTFASGGPPPSSTPVLSSLGIVEQFLGHSFGPHWKVDDVWVADIMMSAEIEAFLWTWKGQIVLSGSFNLAYYSKAEVQAFLARVKGELLGGLGIMK